MKINCKVQGMGDKLLNEICDRGEKLDGDKKTYKNRNPKESENLNGDRTHGDR